MAAKKTTTAPARRTRKTAPAKRTFTLTQIQGLTIPELRALATELNLTETKLKNGILVELKREGHIIFPEGDNKTENAPAPQQRTARKVSASAKKPEPQEESKNVGISKDEMQVRDELVAAIKDGLFDLFILELSDAIDARVDEFEKQQAEAAKKTAAAAKTARARRTTTAKTDARSKMPTVSRKSAPAESASVEEEKPQGGPVRNKRYEVIRSRALKGATVQFLRMDEGDENKAVVKLVKDDQGRKEVGVVFTMPVRFLNV